MHQKYSTPVYTREVPSWIYDGLIAIGLVLTAMGSLRISWLFWFPFAVLVWGSFIEPHLLTVKRYRIGKGERALRIVFLSDMHVGPYKGARWIRHLVRRTNALKPDLILLGGDFIYDASSDPSPLAELRGLEAKCGVVGIMGNHDFHYGKADADAKVLSGAGATVLRNAVRRFSHEGVAYAVVGVEDDWDADTDFEAAMRDVREGDRVIMLIHNPDLAPHAAKFRPEAMLSGHVHGGQIRLPLIGPVPRLPHHLGRRYDRGLFRFDGIPLVLGQGVGESGPRARLFCPPQVVVLELA